MATPLTIVYRPVDKLIPYARNSRTHSPGQVAQIAASIKEFGFTNPVLIDDTDGIIAGHGRVLAAQKLGMTDAPTITLTGLTPAQKRAYVIADNKLALNAGWDLEMLGIEIAELKADEFNLDLLGFDTSELSSLFSVETESPVDPEDTPEAPENPVSVKGDVWVLGRHRIMCGDSTSIYDVKKLCAGVVPQLANCDPPYGIQVVKGGKIGGDKPFGSKGKVHGYAKNAIMKAGSYAPIIGDDTTETAVACYHLLKELGVPVIVLWGGNYFANDLPPSRCWLVWDKENTGSFADAELAWTNQDRVVKLIRHQWSGLIKASEHGQKRVHPTQKPVALANWVRETMAPECETVIDLFLGSGWTLISAQAQGTSLYGMELAPAYVDVAIKRWETYTGQKAFLEASKETYEQVAASRAVPLGSE